MKRVLQGPLLLLCLLLVCNGCHHIDPPTPIPQLDQRQTVGYMVFQTHCSLCHYERVDSPKNGPALVGLFKRPYLPSGAPANDERVSATILHGRGLMPAQHLDSDELAAILAYLHTV